MTLGTGASHIVRVTRPTITITYRSSAVYSRERIGRDTVTVVEVIFVELTVGTIVLAVSTSSKCAMTSR